MPVGNIITINKFWRKLKDLSFKTATKPYTNRWRNQLVISASIQKNT